MEKLGLKLLELLNSGVDLLKDELPIFISQLLTYKTVELSLYVVLSFAALVWSLYTVARKTKTKTVADRAWGSNKIEEVEKPLNEWEDFVRYIVGGSVGFFSLFFFMYSIGDFIKITLAPRIWLLEYATNLISK